MYRILVWITWVKLEPRWKQGKSLLKMRWIISKLSLWKYEKVCTAKKKIALAVSILFYVNSK